MKAVLFSAYGGPEVLSLASVPKPEVGEDELLIKIARIGVNPADAKWRAGLFAGFAPLTFPHILGYDIAGTTEKGRRVAAMLDPLRHGGYAQCAAVASTSLATVPENLSFDVAAAVPTAGLTGLQVIERGLDTQCGQRVLVTGAAGLVGRFAVYAARRRGCEVVAAVRADRAGDALALGAQRVLVLGQEHWLGPRIDLVVDTVGGDLVGELCARLDGVRAIATVSTLPIPSEGQSVKPRFFSVTPNGEDLGRILASVAAGEVPVPISATMPLKDAGRAHELIENGRTKGKVILSPD